MSNTAKEKIIDFIKTKESFSIPTIQKEIGLDYGEIREVISDLEDEKKVEFLEGIVYKWVAKEEKKEENEDSGKDSSFDNFLSKRLRRPWKRHDLDEDKDTEEKDDSDPQENLFADLFNEDSPKKDPLNPRKFSWEDYDDDDEISVTEKLLESNGGPLPEFPDKAINLLHYVSRQRKSCVPEDSFLPKLDITIPGINKPLIVYVHGEEDNSYFYDNGLVAEYIKSKAQHLDDGLIQDWHDIIDARISELGIQGAYVDEEFRYYVPDFAKYEVFEDSLSAFTTSVSKIIDYVKITLDNKRTRDTIDDFKHLKLKHDDIINGVLNSDIGFEDITEFIEKVIEIEPEANSETISHLFVRCSVRAISTDHPQKDKIINFCAKARREYSSSIIVYFILRKVRSIIESDSEV